MTEITTITPPEFTAPDWWDYLPDFAPNFSVKLALGRIREHEREAAEAARHHAEAAREERAEIENRLAAEYTPDEIEAAKRRAFPFDYCPCGERIVTTQQNCVWCGRQLFPF